MDRDIGRPNPTYVVLPFTVRQYIHCGMDAQSKLQQRHKTSSRIMLKTYCTHHDALQQHRLLATSKGEAQYHCRFTLTMALPLEHTVTNISMLLIPITASEHFLSIPTPKQSNLMDYMYAAEVANNNAVEEQTHDDKTRTWEQ